MAQRGRGAGGPPAGVGTREPVAQAGGPGIAAQATRPGGPVAGPGPQAGGPPLGGPPGTGSEGKPALGPGNNVAGEQVSRTESPGLPSGIRPGLANLAGQGNPGQGPSGENASR
jgi:hypothetical protein